MEGKEELRTVSLLSLAFIVAYLIFRADWLLWTAALLALGNAFENRATAAVARWWLKFAHTLGSFNTRLILSALFFAVLTPLAFIYRIMNREKVDHFLRNRRSSYFDTVNKRYTPEEFEKPW